MKKLAILGASGHGAVVADIALSCGWEHIDFFDDKWPAMTNNLHWEVKGNTEDFFNLSENYHGVIVGIGNNAIRLSLTKQLDELGLPLVSLSHPSAVISSFVTIGKGVVIMPNVVINIGSSIGDACILNSNCSVDHDCQLAEGVHISPGALLAGGVKVGAASWIGIGASVRQYLTIGGNTIVGAGAVVVKDVNDDVTVVGVPAKPTS